MNFLLDTNVISDVAAREPNPSVGLWLKSLYVHETYLSVTTVAEVRRGVDLAKNDIHRTRLELWLEDLKRSFGDRILPIDSRIAELAGAIDARCQLAGRPAEAFDVLIAATAELHGLTVATRNTRDFEIWGGPVFNPWAG